jgi:hypothetical protein
MHKNIFFGISIFLLNLFDGIFTAVFLNMNVMVELNPIIAFAYEHVGNWFILPKALLGLIVGVLIYLYFERRSIKLTTYFIFSFYLLLNLYFIFGAIIIFWMP